MKNPTFIDSLFNVEVTTKVLKIKNIIILLAAVALFFLVFISWKQKSFNVDHSASEFITGDQIYYNVFDSLTLKKSQELDEIFNNLNKRGVFNGTVLYSENGQVVFEGAYGYSDFGKRDTLTVHSSFQLASVSKMFTAMAVMILKEQGKLEYDADITQFIPEFPYEGITIRMLLNHRSGLTRYMSMADKYWDINKPVNNEQVIDLFVKYKPGSYFSPDDGFHYCNTNYALLASVVERISGETFDVFAKKNIFDPLEMNDSFVYNLHGESVIPYQIPVGVTGYKYGGRYARKMGNYYLNGVMGDKGVYSSVKDMFKFNCALDQGTLVSPETLSEAFKPGSPAFWKRKDNYGFGWRIKDRADSTAYHFGWWKGFRSFYIRDMKNQKSIVVLTNIGKGFSSEILWDIMEEETTVEELLSIYAHLE